MASFVFWASCYECITFVDFLKLFLAVDVDGSFSMRWFMLHLDLLLES
jgi:hypothetical protein